MKNESKKFCVSQIFCLIILTFCAVSVFHAQTPGEILEKRETASKIFSEAFELFQKNTVETDALAKEKFETAVKLFTELGDRQSLALSLIGLGNIADRAGDKTAALKIFNGALPLIRESGNKSFEATILVSIGFAYSNTGEKQKALESFNLAQSIFQNLDEKKSEASTLVSIGKIYSDLGEAAKTLENYKLALDIQKKIGEKEDEALTLTSIGKFYGDTGENQKAIEFFELALAIYENSGNKYGIALTLNNLSVIYTVLGENRKALENFETNLQIYRELGEQNGEATTLNNIGKIYDDSGEKQKALEYYNRSLTLRRTLGDVEGEAVALGNVGGIYAGFGDKTKALEFYEKSSSLLKSVGDLGGEAITLNNIGLIYKNSGDKKALEFYERALNIQKKIGDKSNEATTLNNLGSYYSDLGEKAKALEFFKRSITLLKAIGDKSREARTLNNIGLVYSELGNLQKALEFYNLALPIFKTVGDKEGEANVLNNIGSHYFALKENKKALEFFNRSLPLSQAVGDKNGEAITLNNIGRVYDDSGDKQKALEYLNRTVQTFKAVGNGRNEAIVLSNIGRIYDDLNNKEKALEFYFRALPISKSVGDKVGEAVTLNNMMHVWNDLKNVRLAVFYGKQSINIFQELRSNIRELDKEIQRDYLKTIEKVYRRLSDILIENGRVAEAEQVLAMLKEEEYFAYLRRDGDAAKNLLGRLALSPDETEAFKRYEEIADKITALGKEQGELYAQSLKFEAGKFPQQRRLDEIERQIADANKVFNLFLDGLKTIFGEEDKRVASVESDTQTLLKEIGEPRTVIISTIAGEDNLNLIVTTTDAQRAHTVKIKAADLNRLVLEFREAAKNSNVDPRPSGKKLYDVLFPAALQKDLDNIGADTIVWSLDGTLRYAPVSALFDGEKYLIERYAVSVITLASRSRLDAPPPDKTNWQVLGAGVSKQATVANADGTTTEFPALAAVPQELCSVVNDASGRCAGAGVLQGKSLLNDEFTLTAFKNNLGRYAVVHIASHFSLSPGNETDSFMLLGGASAENGQPTLSIARLREEFKTKFVGVDLLTLSACNTAMTAGEKSNGLEIEGFGAFAQKQGAKSVLATLWEVADDSTRILMTNFYRLYESGKISKAEAVRQSQIALLKGKSETVNIKPRSGIFKADDEKSKQKSLDYNEKMPYQHPFFWSPFILIGNWR